MLVCDACDKGYHTFCLQPAMDSLPSDPWKCRVSHISHLPMYREMHLPWKPFVKTSSHIFLKTNLPVRECFINQDILKGFFFFLVLYLKVNFTFYPYNLYFQRCRVCTECGVRGLVLPGSAQWFDNYAVCEECQRQRSSKCGVCNKAANPSVTLQCCSICHRLV